MSLSQLICLLLRRRELHSREKRSREDLAAFQQAALARLRRYACENSPFYRNFHEGLRDAPLDQLPVLTKAILMENWDDVVTDRTLRLGEVQEFVRDLREVRMFHDKYYVVSTAGSTGLKGLFVYDRDEWCMILASYARAYDWAGIGVTKRLRLAVVSTTTPWHQSAVVGATLKSWLVPTLRVDSTEPMGKIVEALNAFQPESLVAYAGIAGLLAREQASGRLKISPQAVFCSSEVLTNETRRLIEHTWGLRPFNVYAATETAGIASECTDHQGLQLYEDLVIVEVVDRENKPASVGEYGAKMLVTVLFSRTIPLIRYEMSDSVRLSLRKTGCGRPFAFLDDMQGRMEDTISLKAGTGGSVEIPPNVFHDVMDRAQVDGWHVLQMGEDRLKISVLRPSGDFRKPKLEEVIAAELERRGADRPVIEVEIVSALPRRALGKTPLITALKKEIRREMSSIREESARGGI